MQEQKTNLEKFINSSIEEIRQKMMTICENSYKEELDFQSAIGFIGQVKGLVSDFGCSVVKGYFESRDEPMAFIESGDKRYLNKGKSTKEVITSLGKIGITRSYYQHRSGGNSLFPLDEKLGIKGELLMPDVKEVVLFSCAYNTPEESSRLLEKCSFIKLHPTQIKRAVTNTNDFIETTGSGIMESIRKNETVPESELLVCSLDGVNVLLNENGKKKGRPLERPTSKGNIPSSSYKNVMCGSISHYRITKEKGEKMPQRVGTKYIARMPEKYYPAFKREFEEEIRSASPDPSVAKLVITDAHKSISGYFKKHKKFMQYANYAENGWPIGSGVIEAACKSVVKQRMCRSGQRWSIKGGQAVLNLRAIVKSNRWEGFWNEYTKKYYKKLAA